jgi:hypothetical protein
MRKLLFLVAAVTVVVLAVPSLASAHGTTCNTTRTGETISGSLVVPDNGACTIINSTVGDDVRVGKNAYFQATGSQIGDDVEGNSSLTIFIDTGTTVGGHVEANRTSQLFVFNATVNGEVEAWKSDDKVQVCGNTLAGGLHVQKSGRDILIGDPASGCGANTFTGSSSASIHNNNTDVELTIKGNSFTNGNMLVADNKGTSDKLVQDNKGGKKLDCFGNEQPFTASGNTGWKDIRNQCKEPPVVCNNQTLTGQTIPDDLVVPDNAACTIINSTVGDDVKVGENSFFQSTGSTINGHVSGNRSQTIFIDTGSTVGDGVESGRTAQLFVFGSTVTGDVEASKNTDKVQICGNTINGDVNVHRSGRDILVGDPVAACGGNTIQGGHEVDIRDNDTDVELVVSGNTLQGGDLEVNNNDGTSDKFVQNNTGNGGTLECNGNDNPFTGTPNSGFASTEGQCS